TIGASQLPADLSARAARRVYIGIAAAQANGSDEPGKRVRIRRINALRFWTNQIRRRPGSGERSRLRTCRFSNIGITAATEEDGYAAGYITLSNMDVSEQNASALESAVGQFILD